MGDINTSDYLGMIHSLLAKHDFPREKFRIVPGLERPGMSWEGNILIRDRIGEDEGASIFAALSKEGHTRLRTDIALRISCLVLHEMYHCRNNFKPISQLSSLERMANEIEADEWAVKQLELK